MRLWQTSEGDLVTDEQVLARIAEFGSLSAALKAGDVILLAADERVTSQRRRLQPCKETTLRDYLEA